MVLNHFESNSWIHRGKRWFRNPDFTSRYGENIGRSFHEGFIPGGCLGFLNHHLSNQYTIYSIYIYRISYIYIYLHTSIAPLSRCLLGCFVALTKNCHLFFPCGLLRTLHDQLQEFRLANTKCYCCTVGVLAWSTESTGPPKVRRGWQLQNKIYTQY